MRTLVFLPIVFLFACANGGEKEVAELKVYLGEAQHDIARMPIYADPATGDYVELKQGKFSVQDSVRLEQIRAHKDELEEFIVQRIDSAQSFAYLAAYLRYPSAVPELKAALLRKDYYQFYGWESTLEDTSAAGRCNVQLEDHQYPYQLSAIAAIEYISGKPLHEAAKLTPAEEAALENDAKGCNPANVDDGSGGFTPACTACWLLSKFKGEKPPHF